MYRPANSVPYATVEADLQGVFLKYCMMGPKGRLITRSISEVEQKCITFQHWIHQWTHGNLLVTRLEGTPHMHVIMKVILYPFLGINKLLIFFYFHFAGVETKLTNVRVVTKSKGFVLDTFKSFQ